MTISLKAKNPFKEGSIELVSWKTWLGVVGFIVIGGITYAGIKFVAGKTEGLNPIDDMIERMT